ncbi:hypothetical protein BDN72DRAFT_897202 [Pluteus cervinus]|uniref:Uncharacterized protein n=1 Tax=Pluteus cervinus TaxID=181527 RepID=A0ACD3AW81_9AGAR|nr:hypothetical protein BDN72DRAFT_897202 [Pluteus cervinus]
MLCDLLLSVLLLFFVAITSSAAPTTLAKTQIVCNPHITSPKKYAKWAMGSTHNVTWDIINIPPEKISSRGVLLLGHGSRSNENLNISHPLATDFPINHGWVSVTVPHGIEPRSDYMIVLFGDSGNVSPPFHVVHEMRY